MQYLKKSKFVLNYLFLFIIISLPASLLFLPLTLFIMVLSIVATIDDLKRKGIYYRVSTIFRWVAYIALDIYWAVILFFIVREMGLGYLFMILGFIACFLFLHFRIDLLKRSSFRVGYWILVGALVYYTDYYMVYVVYACLTALMVILGTYKYDFLSRVNLNGVVLFCAAFLSIAVGGVFYWGIPEGEYREIEKEPCINTIFGYGQDPALDKVVGCHIKFVSESCDGRYIYIGSLDYSGIKARLVAFDKVTRNFRISDGLVRTSYNASMDCERGLLYTIELFEDEIFVFRQDDISEPSRSLPLKNRDAWTVFPLTQGKALFVSSSGQFEILDADDGTRWAHRRISGDLAHFSIPVIDDHLVLYHHPHLEIMGFDVEEREIFRLRRLEWEQLRYGHKAIEELPEFEGPIFLTSMLPGNLYLIDPEKGIVTDHVKLERGIRFYYHDRMRNLLYVGGYVKGNLYFVDIKDMSMIKKIYMGRRIRWIDLSRDRKRILLGSAAGAFEVDIEEALGK